MSFANKIELASPKKAHFGASPGSAASISTLSENSIELDDKAYQLHET